MYNSLSQNKFILASSYGSWLRGVSSPASSGPRSTDEVTILMVNSSQVKTRPAGAIFSFFLPLLPLSSASLPTLRRTLHRGAMSPRDGVPPSHCDPPNAALMNWEPPSGPKTPA